MNTSLSIFARGLASENISFSFDNKAETASFDVQNRHLVMPVWNVSETVQTMLVAHEISHALWTPYERSAELLLAAEADGFNIPLLQKIANVIEDVRIEKKMKDKFPGTRRDFFLGYKEIVDRDMFGFAKADMNAASFLSRLNIHYKWGVPGFIAVPFNDEEQEIVEMVDRVETFDQVMELAKYLYRHPSMESLREEIETMAQDGKGKGNPDGVSSRLSKEVVDGEGIGKKDGEMFRGADIHIAPINDLSTAIVSTDSLLAQFDAAYAAEACDAPDGFTLNMDAYRQYVRESDAFVRQLVAQFERKKAADEIRRERPKQTGTLNLDRLHQYRTHDDIFLSKIIKQDGKNHGIVFVLDFSGSMSHILRNAYLQVLQLVWFCEKAKIPFEVFSFTDIADCNMDPAHYAAEYEAWKKSNPRRDGDEFVYSRRIKSSRECLYGMVNHSGRLVNLASSRDDAAKRERILAYLFQHFSHDGFYPRPSCLSLGGTPTVEAVAIASQFMQEWVKANNIQIPTIMVVTDGTPSSVCVNVKDDQGKLVPEGHFYNIQQGATLTVTNTILNTVTRLSAKDYEHIDLSNMVIATMLNGLRTQLNARCIGMYVGGNYLGEREFASMCMSPKERDEINQTRPYVQVKDMPRYAAAKEAYAEGCVILHPDRFPGYDCYFYIKTPEIIRDEDAIAESGTFTKVKNQFIKTMGKKAGSRVFLTRYVDIVAGQPLKKYSDELQTVSLFPAGYKPSPIAGRPKF